MQTVTGRTWFWPLWLALLAIKLWLAWRLPLFVDEAWYWLEGQHLAWAYSDLPGLTAWLARLGVETAGHSMLALRWPFLALAMAVPVLLRAATRQCWGAGQGEVAGILAMLMPLLGSLGFLALPDVPLTFAATLCLYAGLRLVQRVEKDAVIWLGVGLILGAFSHYRFLPVIAAGAVGLCLDPGGRRALRDARVWLAIALGAVAWWPLIAWNLEHQDAGLQFQLAERHPWRLHAEGVWLPLSQLLFVTPPLLILLLASLARVWRRWRDSDPGPWGFVLGTSVVPLFGYLLLAFVADRERVSFHWLLQAWLPLLVVAPELWRQWTPWARRATGGLAAIGLGVVLAYVALVALPKGRESLAESRWYPDNFAGWKEIGAELRRMPEVASGEAEVIADNFKLGAQLAFELQQPDLPMLDHRLNHKHGRAVQLQLWDLQNRLDASPKRPRLLVVEDSAIPVRDREIYYAARCQEARGLRLLREVRVDRGAKRFALFEPGPGSASGPRCDRPSDHTDP